MFGTYKVAVFRKRTLPPDASQYLSKRPLGMPENQQNHSGKWLGRPVFQISAAFRTIQPKSKARPAWPSSLRSACVRMPFCKAGNTGVCELCGAVKMWFCKFSVPFQHGGLWSLRNMALPGREYGCPEAVWCREAVILHIFSRFSAWWAPIPPEYGFQRPGMRVCVSCVYRKAILWKPENQ